MTCLASFPALVFCILVLLSGMPAPALGEESFAPASSCGVRSDSRIVPVTSIDPDAPGGLLAALAAPGPKIVTFAVGGVIPLGQDIQITTPFTTIAGETAPEPGITLTGGSVRIRSHDICIRHVSVRPGPASVGTVNGERDGIAIGANPRKAGGAVERVVIENVSVSWAVDENVSIWHTGTNAVQIRSAIIAEGLRNAGHPKGAHSMGMLIASDVRDIAVSDSIFAHNNDRNPRISPNTQVLMQDNLIYNPGAMATEVHLNCAGPQPEVSLLRNLHIPGQDTRRAQPAYVFVDGRTKQRLDSPESCATGFARITRIDADGAQSRHVYEDRLRHAGSRPFFRNPEDARIIASIRDRTGRIRDVAPPIEQPGKSPRHAGFVMPADPFRADASGQLAIASALCEAHLALGGLPSRGCSASAAAR